MAALHAAGIDRVRIESAGADRHRLSRLTLFPAHPVESWQGLSFPGNNWIDGWVRWDSFWYESIVDPHPRFVPEYLSNANFFPFYSWVSWLVALPLRAFLDLEHAFYIGALIVSSASFLLASPRWIDCRRGWSARMWRRGRSG